jgi:hypothetical protein
MYATLRLTVSQCVNDSSSIMSDLNMLCVQLFSKVGQETDSSMKATSKPAAIKHVVKLAGFGAAARLTGQGCAIQPSPYRSALLQVMICLEVCLAVTKKLHAHVTLVLLTLYHVQWRSITCNAFCSLYLLLLRFSILLLIQNNIPVMPDLRMNAAFNTNCDYEQVWGGVRSPGGPPGRRPHHGSRRLPVWWALLLHGHRLASLPSCRCHATARLCARTVAPNGVPMPGCQACRSPHTSSAAAAPTWSLPASAHTHTAASQVCSSSARLGASTWA